MKRLTTDDEKSIVFSLNTFYAKDGEVWIRGGGPYPDYPDCTLVQWIKSAAEKHNLCIEGEDPEHLGDEMYDALQDGDETVEGILALMHLAAVQATEMRERLKPIEDILSDDYDLDRLRELIEADRAGQCGIPPVKLHQKLFRVFDGEIQEEIVTQVIWEPFMPRPRWKIYRMGGGLPLYWENVAGKTVHLTREAAEAMLKGVNSE